MSYRFTKEQIKDKGIVSSRQFDNAVGTFVDAINGGLDRDNIRVNSINDGMIADNAFCKFFFLNDQFVADEYQNLDANTNAITPNRPECQLGGMTYGKPPLYDGGQRIEGCSKSMTTEEGMLELSWHCTVKMGQYWPYYKDHTNTRVALKWCQWEIRVDGTAVYTGPHQYENTNTFIHRCNVPISKGTHIITVHYKVARREEDDDDQVIMNWWGGQLVGINRYR